jgi:hypothetical protein
MSGLSLSHRVLGVCIGATVLAGCGAQRASIDAASTLPLGAAQSRTWQGLTPVSLASLYEGNTTVARRVLLGSRQRPPKCGVSCGLWASEFGATALDRFTYGANAPPVCLVPNIAYVNDIDTIETKADLYVPDGGSDTIDVFHYSPRSDKCPKKPEYSILDGPANMPIGQPSDVVPLDQGSTFFVANIVDYTSSPPYYGPGSVSVCNQSACTNYSNPAITGYAGGVTSDFSGNCYLSAEGGAPSSPFGVLLYYPNCTGPGEQTTGFVNPSTGGLAVDQEGNIVAISISDATAYVYKGCPNCQLLSKNGLMGSPIYGHFSVLGGLFVVGDAANGSLDFYDYYASGISARFTYLYSVTDGLYASETPEAAAFIGFHRTNMMVSQP